MTISQDIWRFQCDPNGENDPDVQVFLKKTLVDPDTGEIFEKTDSTPVTMKFSELAEGLQSAKDIAITKEADLQPMPPILALPPVV